MNRTNKNKLITIIIAVISLLLASIAVYTGIKLYQLSQTKKLQPEIELVEPAPCSTSSGCEVVFYLQPHATSTPTPTGTLSPTPTPTPTAIPTSTPTSVPTNTPTSTPTPTGTLSPTPTGTLSPTPTSTPTSVPTDGPTPTPIPGCWDTCLLSDGCASNLSCINERCANPECPDETDCICPAPEIPLAGISTPTIFIAIGGFVLLILGLLF